MGLIYDLSVEPQNVKCTKCFNYFEYAMVSSYPIDSKYEINASEHRRDNQKWTVQRKWQHRLNKTKKTKTKTQRNVCWTQQYVNKYKQGKQDMNPPTNNVNKTWTLLQTTGCKDEPNIYQEGEFPRFLNKTESFIC